MIKEYVIEYEWWEAKVIIDEEKAKENIKAMVEFWYGWEHNLYLNDGDYTKTFLQQLGKKLIIESMDYNLGGILFEFEDCEGWTKMDGSSGIMITYIDSWEFTTSDFTIEEKEV